MKRAGRTFFSSLSSHFILSSFMLGGLTLNLATDSLDKALIDCPQGDCEIVARADAPDRRFMLFTNEQAFPETEVGENVVKTFIIKNNGERTLILPSGVSAAGIHSGDFVVSRQPASSVAVGEFTTFDVTFSPSAQYSIVCNTNSPETYLEFPGNNYSSSLRYSLGASSTITRPTSATVAATVFLEGAWNGTNMNTLLKNGGLMSLTAPYDTINHHNGSESVTSDSDIAADVVDWVLVELREAGVPGDANDASRVGSAAGFLKSNGQIVATDGSSDLTVSLSGNTGSDFYVVVYHRNHLPIMSASAISESSGTYSIDFTSNSANTYQTTTALASLAGSKFGMPAGDTNGDGNINATDLATWRNNNGVVFNYGTNGAADFNLDGVINAVDRNDFHKKNTSKTRQVPTT